MTGKTGLAGRDGTAGTGSRVAASAHRSNRLGTAFAVVDCGLAHAVRPIVAVSVVAAVGGSRIGPFPFHDFFFFFRFLLRIGVVAVETVGQRSGHSGRRN